MKRKGIIGLFLGILLLTACGKKQEEEIKVPAKNIISEKIAMREMSQIFQSDVVLEPKEKVSHTTEKGGTIEKIYKKNGDSVQKGELIVSFSDSLTKASYLKALADFQTAQSSYRIAQGNFGKFKQLYDRGLVSHLEYVNYENAFVAARGQYEVASALYQSAKNDYNKLERRADIGGVVANLFGKEGNTVKALEEVFIVLNDSQMQAYVGLPGEYISKIKEGDSLKVHVDSLGKNYEAKIKEINPIADSVTKNFRTKLVFSNENREIKDGMYASVVLPVGSQKVLSIPDEAIFVRNLIAYVFKVENGKAARVEVKVGAQNGEYTAIQSSDIKEGDSIVVRGLFGLQDGDAVRESTTGEIDLKQGN